MGAVRRGRAVAPDLILATSLDYWRYAALGPPGSRIRRLSRLWSLRQARSSGTVVVAGHWGGVGAHRAAVFVRDGQLRIAFERLEWPLDSAMTAEWQRSGRTAELQLLRHGSVVAACEYRVPRPPRQHWSDWPLDPEDWDFGRFIVRMIERRTDEPALETVWPFRRRLRGSEPA